jgi:hypothetical protein
MSLRRDATGAVKLVNTTTAAFSQPGVTLRGWVYLGAVNVQMTIFGCFADSTSNAIRFALDNTGHFTLQFREQSGTQSFCTGATVQSANTWIPFCAIVNPDGSTAIYITSASTPDGTAVAPTNGTTINCTRTCIMFRHRTTEDDHMPEGSRVRDLSAHNWAFSEAEREDHLAGHAGDCFTNGGAGTIMLYQELETAANTPGSAGAPTYGPTLTLTNGVFSTTDDPVIDTSCGVGGGTNLPVSDAAMALSAETVTLSLTEATLPVSDAAMVMTADSVTLDAATPLEVSDATMALAAEQITLAAGTPTLTGDAAMALEAETVSMTGIIPTITMEDAVMALVAPTVELRLPVDQVSRIISRRRRRWNRQ